MTRLIKYLRETKAEMKHVSWPTQKQAMIYTAMVIGISVIAAILLGSFDYIFTGLLNLVV